MSEMIMTKPMRHKIVPANPFSAEARFKRRLVRALQAWPSAEALAADMEIEKNIHRDVSTWTRYRAGTRMPPAWLAEELLQMSVEQTRNQIRALEQRLAEIGG